MHYTLRCQVELLQVLSQLLSFGLIRLEARNWRTPCVSPKEETVSLAVLIQPEPGSVTIQGTTKSLDLILDQRIHWI